MAPVTSGNGAMFVPNHMVNRSLTRPWRSSSGMWSIVCCSTVAGASTAADASAAAGLSGADPPGPDMRTP